MIGYIVKCRDEDGTSYIHGNVENFYWMSGARGTATRFSREDAEIVRLKAREASVRCEISPSIEVVDAGPGRAEGYYDAEPYGFYHWMASQTDDADEPDDEFDPEVAAYGIYEVNYFIVNVGGEAKCVATRYFMGA